MRERRACTIYGDGRTLEVRWSHREEGAAVCLVIGVMLALLGALFPGVLTVSGGAASRVGSMVVFAGVPALLSIFGAVALWGVRIVLRIDGSGATREATYALGVSFRRSVPLPLEVRLLPLMGSAEDASDVAAREWMLVIHPHGQEPLEILTIDRDAVADLCDVMNRTRIPHVRFEVGQEPRKEPLDSPLICMGCGYSLIGLLESHPRCPECGLGLSAKQKALIMGVAGPAHTPPP